MSKENVTFRIDSDKRAAIDAIAAGLDRDRCDILNEAINLYLTLHQWQLGEIRQGIAEAEADDFATADEVQAVFDRLTHAR